MKCEEKGMSNKRLEELKGMCMQLANQETGCAYCAENDTYIAQVKRHNVTFAFEEEDEHSESLWVFQVVCRACKKEDIVTVTEKQLLSYLRFQ